MLRGSKVGTHHVFAECRDCKKSWGDYLTAAKEAREHASCTGHTVHVKRWQAWTYNPKLDGGIKLSKHHQVKSWPDFYEPILDGRKKFDLRQQDRNYATGDTIEFLEYDDRLGRYTGRKMTKIITFVMEGIGSGAIKPVAGLFRGYAILSLGDVE
jgi:hypothetical protein